MRRSNAKQHTDAIDMNLCEDNAIELNNWNDGEHAWIPPAHTSAPDNKRRAHELFCVPCLKHLMPAMLQDHINQDKHDRALAWWKTQKHRKDERTPRSVNIPPPSSIVQKFPPPPPSSRKQVRSRSPKRKEPATSSKVVHERFQTVDLTTEMHEEADEDSRFTTSLPAFMRPGCTALDLTNTVPANFPGAFPPPPPPLHSMFYPEGHLETRAKSAAVVVPVVDDNLEWADWKPPDSFVPPVPPAPPGDELAQTNRSRMIQLELPRPPSPPRSLTMSNLQQEFPGATIIIVPPGGSFPFGNMQASTHMMGTQNPVQLGTTVIQVPNPWQNPQGQPFFQHPSMQYPVQWPSMFHPWR